ncbi:zinc finger and BTB domain-containing protein 41-like isoform X1 [Ostrinia furnacalis]|uniref:zinc finger and BTB domain-containing protein 41-like isoform X1 n=1 Tax=Ostrinia furnacalis TaxID=93504 RepID=UPI00103D3E4B|nr:zinc finger and BTB domain-containing protein 41-like isoform X1 [Ostrinia furnacalis]
MNVLRTKGKFHKIFSTENVSLHASGDGAAAGRCCRLCGGDTSLRAFGDTYVWEGVEERYDQLLYDCFGVRVTQLDNMICEWCVRQLRNTERFKALVHAAFDKPPSSSIPSPTVSTKVPDDILKNENIGIINNKSIIELLKTKMSKENRKSKRGHPKPLDVKRTNVQCKVCKQKYPMIVPANGCKEFVCSRCKKNNDKQSLFRKSYVAMPTGMTTHMRFQSGMDLKWKNRLSSLSKKPSQTKRQENPLRSRFAKFKCSICPKKYTTSAHLVEHMKLVHGERKNTMFAKYCVLCGRHYRTKELLDKHLQMHLDNENLINSRCASRAQLASKMHARE